MAPLPHVVARSPQRSSMSDFLVEGEIAKGSFGVVMRCIRLSDNRQFAIKQVEMKGMNKAEREECIDEARVMSTLDSPYVVRYFDCFIDGTKLCMVMNYAPGGTLHASIRKHPGGLPEEQCWKNVIHVALALRHLHGKNVLHRDIKSLNVFLDEFGDIQVGDLGIARQMSNSTLFAKTVVGTPYYLSPELCEDKPYNTKSDLWALGVLAYEMAAGRHPFDAQNEGALIRKIVKGVYAPLPTARFSKAYCDLVYGLLAKEPLKRPSAAALLGSPAVKAVAERLRQPLDGSPPPARAAAIAAARRAEADAAMAEAARRDEDLAAELTAKLPPPSAEAVRERTMGASARDGGYGAAALPQAPSTPPPASPPPPPQRLEAYQPRSQMYETTQQRAQAAINASQRRGIAGAGVAAYDPQSRAEVQRAAAAAAVAAKEAAAVNARAGRHSDLGGVLAGNFYGAGAGNKPSRSPARLKPEEQPAAGQRKHSEPLGGNNNMYGAAVGQSPSRSPARVEYQPVPSGHAAPFGGAPDPMALHREDPAAAVARNAVYTPPTFGRRRARDIAITGPSMRNPGGSQNTAARPASAGRMAGGGYAGARMAPPPQQHWANASIGTATTTTATTYLMRR